MSLMKPRSNMRSASSRHQHLHGAQIEDALLGEVDDAARRADQHVHALLEDVALLVVVDAAEREPELEARCASRAPRRRDGSAPPARALEQ
jgi:hypothetical protein